MPTKHTSNKRTYYLLATAIGLLAFVFVLGGVAWTEGEIAKSVELGIAAASPAGPSAGLVIPASCSGRAKDGDLTCSPPSISLVASPTSIDRGNGSTLSWLLHHGGTSSGAAIRITSCTKAGGWSGSLPDTLNITTGSQVVFPVVTTTYTLNCTTNVGSLSKSATVTVTVPPPPPTATLSASPTSIVLGSSSTLTWSSTNATSCAGVHTVSGVVIWSGGVTTSGSTVVSPTTTTMYTLTCTGAGGTSAPSSATVTVTAPLQPNLRSQNLIHYSGTLQNGQVVRFRATVNNNGAAGTPRTFSDEFSYQWNGTGGAWTPWSVIAEAILAQSASRLDTSANLTLSAPGSGTQNLYVQHCIDSTSVIGESNESVADNCEVIGALSVSPAPACSNGIDDDGDGLIDLTDPGCTDGNDNDETNLTNLRSQNLIHLSGTLQNGQTVRFRATVNNNSTVATPRTFSDEFSYQWNGTGGTWTPWSVIPKSVLAAGASSQDTSSNLTLSAPGSGTQNLYVQHCIDSTLVIAESNESVADNCEVIGALSVSPAPACSDGLDNDGDGKTDYPADPGCSSAADTNETDPPACSNGIDDDGDGLSDSNDPSCHTDGNASNPGSYLPTITSEDDVSIVASPALVRSGSTSTVTWSAGGTPTSCLVTGPGVSSTAQSGSASTGVITEQRTYLISCDYGGFQRTAIATIIVLPAFEEF